VVKRVFLFVLTNIAILVMVSIVLAVLGQLGVLGLAGSQGSLLIICAIWGFGASFVSLLLSRWMAKRALGVHLIGPDVRDADAQWLYATVSRLAQQANLPMPEVGIYDSPEVNAFATGPSKKRSLVAVSSGLFRSMNKQEIEGVLAHEITHVANGDMVTMALVQGVVNAFVLYLSHIVAMIARNALSSRDDDRGPSFLGVIAGQLVFIAAQIAFGLIGSMITAWFSRQREFRADAGGAGLAGRGSMVSALRRLMAHQEQVDRSNPEYATMKIAGGKGWLTLFSTHPPLEERIAALESRA
jgi:heat shock protein HtpX